MALLDTAPRLAEPVALALPDLVGPARLGDERGVATLGLFIDGEWRRAQGGNRFEVRSPVDGGVIARVPKAATEDVEAAIGAAFRARAAWRAVPAYERLEVLERAADLMGDHLDAFADVIVADLGKTPEQARSEASATRERLRLAREEVRKIFGEYLPGDWIRDAKGKSGVVLREPLGTVAAIGPFNYPLFLAASKIIPALVAGNTVVAKAPSADPLALVLFTRVLQEAGVPDGALNLIAGSGAEMGDLLAGHEDISMVSFTGSSAVGRRIARRASPKPLHLELGGNAAAIVLSDADLERAVARTAQGAFKNAGQRCDAVSRVLVERAVYEEYLDRAVSEASNWTMGDPRAEGVKVGPLVNEKAAEAVNGLVEDAVGKGARLLQGGGHQDAYVEPAVLADVPLDADIVWEETFGPVLAALPVDSLDEAIEIANRSRYGLDSAVFTSNLDRAWKAAAALECGMVHVNDAPAHGVGHFPFGGAKPDSGIGREGLGYSIDECTRIKTVVLPT